MQFFDGRRCEQGVKWAKTGSGVYRYGFNGQEKDNEVKGEGNQQDYGMRVYDPRLGRFLSVDPLQKKFPFFTPYQFAGNSPIANIDLDGLEDYNYNLIEVKKSDGKPVLIVVYSGREQNDLLDDVASFLVRKIITFFFIKGSRLVYLVHFRS